MSGSFCLICLSLIVVTVPSAWCQSHDQDASRERPVAPHRMEVQTIKPDDPRARLKGLCRDGWSPGRMKDFSGKEIPICLKINPEALTWSEAQQECRRDYGFLMKFDSRATIDETDLLSSVITNDITKFWTGMHSENSHLIWDDLIPNQVRPHNSANGTLRQERPWIWDSSLVPNRPQYCGQMNVEMEDKRRRKKRSSDDDSSDNNFPSFDFSNFRSSMFNNDFPQSNKELPPTSAFETLLSRTQMSDQLAELPGILGLQSEHQIPGSGNPDANIQNGGLATDMPTFGTTSNFEQQDTDTVTPFENIESNNGDTTNTDSNENPVTNPLLTSVKEIAAKIESNSGDLPTPTPTEAIEALRDLMQQNAENLKPEISDLKVPDNSFVSGTTVVPPTTEGSSDSNGLDVGTADDTLKLDNLELKEIGKDDLPTMDRVDDSNKLFPTDAKVTDGGTGDDSSSSNVPDMIFPKADTKDDNSKGIAETLSDNLKDVADVPDSTDDASPDGSLGFGQLTDFLTNTAVNEAMDLSNTKDTFDNGKDIVDDLSQGTSQIDSDDFSNDNKPDVLTTVLKETEKSEIENIDPLNTISETSEKLDSVLKDEADKDNSLDDVISTVDLTDESTDFKMNEGLENVKESFDNLLPESSSLDDVPAIDTPETDELVTDANNDESNFDQIETDKDKKLDHLNKQETFENINEAVDMITDTKDDISDFEILKGNSVLENTDEGNRAHIADMHDNDVKSHIDQISDSEINLGEQIEDSDHIGGSSDDVRHSEDIVRDSGNFEETKENDKPEVEMEPVKTDYFDDMSERLGMSEETPENESKNVADEDKDILPDTVDDPLDYLKGTSENSFNQESFRGTDTGISTDDIENTDDVVGSKVDQTEQNDDGHTKRDSDWSEFDWNNNDQETATDSAASEVDDYDVSDPRSFVQEDINADENDFGENNDKTDINENNFGRNDQNSDINEKDFEGNNENNENNDMVENDAEGNTQSNDMYENLENENIDDTQAVLSDNDHETLDGLHAEADDNLGQENEANANLERDFPDSYFEDKEERDRFDEIPDLAEDVVENNRKTALMPIIESKEMQLASCEVKLPSVCFSYEVEVMDKASTCDTGWYGHVLLDTCYQILEKKMSYRKAVLECQSKSARLVLAGSDFERMFVLTAVMKDGKLFRGAKFWMESPNDKLNCNYFDERGIDIMSSCNSKLNVVCVKDAKSLSVYKVNNQPFYNEDAASLYDNAGVQRLFSSRRGDNKIPCELTSAASEFPVLWFKDGLLVETKDTYVSNDISLFLNSELVSSISMVTDRSLAMPALQGLYWCEVWDRQTLTRKRSKSFKVRFSDVISFHGSMELSPFSHKNELLFNMMNQKFPELVAIETDIKKVFKDVLPMIQTRLPDVADVFTYIDGIRSNPNVLEYHTYFYLNKDYSTNDEDLIYNRIKAALRSKLGNRFYMAELPGHTPLAAFRTMSLQSTVACPAASLQTTRDLYGHTIPVKVFSFPKALLGEFANSIDNCSITNRLPSGTARCLGDFYTGAYWGEVVANECIEEGDLDEFNNEIWGASPYTDKLTEIAQVTVDARNVEKIVSEIANIAKVAPKFTPTDINKIADVLDHTTQVRNLPPEVGENVLKTVDRLMRISDKETHVANVETKAANRIIKSLERYAENADIGTKDQMRFVSDNVVIEIWDIKPSTKPVIGLAAESHGSDKPFRTENIATVYNKSHLYDANVDAAIELPAEVFGKKEKGATISDRLTMMVFRKSKLFKAAITDGGRKMSLSKQQLSNLNSYVISASIAGKKLQDLNEKVKTIFKPIKNVESGRSCVWWDFDMNNFKGGWSSKGCVYDGKVNGRDVCLCDHLTNFAVLIDFYGQAKPIPDHHELSLSIITVLGLSCSILGLSLTIISYLFFRKLRQGRAQQTLFNLSLSLLLSMLVFLVGIRQTHSYFGCITVAILLHYLILVSFMWMLMEAILQYLTFVKILGTYITRFTLKTVLPAWGLPLVPVIAVLCVDYTLYKGGPNYCWMDLPAFYYAFAIPVTCIIVINIIIFIVTIVSIFRRGKGLRSNQKKQKMAMTNLQAAVTSFILLGLTWVFGYLAISDARLPFQYVFTILNSLQGFFIFILFVVRKKKVREQWYFICCKGMEKDRVSRSLSASNSIPSTYSNGSNRNSRKDGRERDRSDSTKTVQSTYSNSSNGFTNYGYDHGYDFPFNRYDRRAFKKF
ncbi:uncharacterized protein LOC123529498 isoform X2 [Mercenaria mercenaria]|uniref:uncharacterized protein LOC123529498 isoform X2 n=1 Tax=Mercenaria mercenaria TaxID=6596 RepID=UPI00234F9097|nr:uncharacterized protein LOC123529498 isoform X2 [Mercenaria mercenaria]XP_045165786.2 uncharacterized protein LOC123529498 isoform X2 [Mercenaria mercenaria]